MIGSVFCPTCSAKICEISLANDLRVKCKKCKNIMIIDKDETALKVQVLDKALFLTTKSKIL